MEYVKKTISLPVDVFEFARKDAAQKAEAQGEEINLSKYFRDLIRTQRSQGRPKQKKAA